MPLPPVRSRRDRCPGILRPWPADDGALVRVRLVGGQVSSAALLALGDVAGRYGDGRIHLTGRANLQLRALPWDGDQLPEEVIGAVERTGLLPSRSHELARNLMCSPHSGLCGGRADLRPVVRELDARLCARAELADLPGRFLFVLDDGRGDLVDRETDLGAVALDAEVAQLRLGPDWGAVVPLTAAAEALTDLAADFQRERGDGPTAAWHVRELETRLMDAQPGDGRLPEHTAPPPYGKIGCGEHVRVPNGILTADLCSELAGSGRKLVVTPWHSVLVVTP